MNKVVVLLFLTLLSFGLTGCGDDKDLTPMDLGLFDGIWEVVDEGNQDVFGRGCILKVNTAPDFINGTYGGYYGDMTTYYLTVSGVPIHDKAYSWSIREIENYQPLLEVVFKGDADDSDDLWEGDYFYKITKLTDSHLWMKGNSIGYTGTIKLRRRTDVKID